MSHHPPGHVIHTRHPPPTTHHPPSTIHHPSSIIHHSQPPKSILDYDLPHLIICILINYCHSGKIFLRVFWALANNQYLRNKRMMQLNSVHQIGPEIPFQFWLIVVRAWSTT